MNATIYDMQTGDIITEGLQSALRCDDAINTARSLARHFKTSVIVEDYGTGECYRITPAGWRWRAPKGWTMTSDDDE